jgi:hypothetical protein
VPVGAAGLKIKLLLLLADVVYYIYLRNTSSIAWIAPAPPFGQGRAILCFYVVKTKEYKQ